MFFHGQQRKGAGIDQTACSGGFPHIEVETYSPPYKPEFSEEDNRAIVEAINKANPDLLDRDDCPQTGEMGVHALE